MIRVFVGCAPNGEDAESLAVLEYTLRLHASEPVEITWMALSRDASSPFFGWNTGNWATPFSGFRYAVPSLCGFAGRAIYVDSDFIFLADIAELWRQEFQPGKVAMRHPRVSWRLCISLWDCERAEAVLPPIDVIRANSRTVATVMRDGKFTQAFDGEWNCLDGEGRALGDPAVKAIHYTDMSCQPQLRHALPRLKREGKRHWYNGPVRPHPRADIQGLFDKLLGEAQSNGYRVENYIPAQPYGEFSKADLARYRGRAA